MAESNEKLWEKVDQHSKDITEMSIRMNSVEDRQERLLKDQVENNTRVMDSLSNLNVSTDGLIQAQRDREVREDALNSLNKGKYDFKKLMIPIVLTAISLGFGIGHYL